MGCTKSAAGMVGSFFFFAYGIGQVVNGFMAKHMNEKLFMTAALFGSALCNIAMCFAPSVEVMKYIWLLNGIAMSPLWCNVVKVQGKYVSDKNMPRSLMMTGLTTPIGTALNYGLCALVATFFNWRVSFWIAAALMTFMAILWYFTLNDIERCAVPVEKPQPKSDAEGNAAKPKAKLTKVLLIGLIIMFTAGMFTQFAREGLNAWVPSILYEVYMLPSTLSISLTLLLPLLASFSNFILVALEKKSKDFLLLSILFVGVHRFRWPFWFPATVLTAWS
jgi:OPA family glycerol-3-phosphate transporter-like MFS transporter